MSTTASSSDTARADSRDSTPDPTPDPLPDPAPNPTANPGPDPIQDPSADPRQDISVDSERSFDGEPDPVSRAPHSRVAERNQAPVAMIALRDIAVFAGILAIFGGADSWARTTDLALAHFVVVFVGLFGGAALAALGHEWGHFAGARLGGGRSPTKPIKAFPLVFDFDYSRNSQTSFLWMSMGGSVGNWGMALFLMLALALGSAGPDAVVAGAVAYSVFTAFVEFPVIKNARAGMSAPDALMLIPKDFATRYLPQSLIAAFLTFIIL